MHLNTFGKIAETQWIWLARQYSYVKLHAFIIMPNHMHGIIEINRDVVFSRFVGPAIIKIKSLSELIGAYKTSSSKQIHLAGMPAFSWQRSFYDHIIRNEYAYRNITHYIQNKPKNWQ